MSKWEFAIAVRDEADLDSGHKRKKEGDLVAVKPYPWKWGTKEVDEYLIVVGDGLTEEEANDLCQPHYEGGIFRKDIPPMIPGEDPPEPIKCIGKNRFSIPLSIIKKGWKPDLVETDVRDKKKVYQPLKDNDIVIDFSEHVAICKDNHTGTFKYITEKIAE
jgi:hypothetical protein